MPPTPKVRLLLASRSPRRAALLREAGYAFEQVEPPFEDPASPRMLTHPRREGTEGAGRQAAPGAVEHAVELARQKAESLLATLGGEPEPAVILAADTICVAVDGELVGTPHDRAEAASMLRGFVGGTHDVVTGVALVRSADATWRFIGDSAKVTWGILDDARLEAYLDTEGWQGKAGGYNLFDRQRDGWPIRVDGDPGTVVGLPMQRLPGVLAELGVEPQS